MLTQVQFTPTPEYKTVLLGNGSVGKSALVKKEIAIDGTICIVKVLDIAGTISFDSIYIANSSFESQECSSNARFIHKNGDGFIVMYSLIDAATLTDTT
ncbi:hypothetical protein LOAG_02268 [Loa loa]|uniref:Ras family protein n=1 Tax=Loa loa TaxID=7209 RepID=A0A1S0U6Y8_LOALO|nr:hypothetical protein LOAG_02268 [Loa loa]EFO26215.1 hypothetical protein LOAG_02268 [Loa loa]